METIHRLLTQSIQRILLPLCVLLISALIFGGGALAYDGNSTHPVLTHKIGEVYNKLYSNQLSSSDIAAMVEGSINEDISPRWINHFYDPTTGRGWGNIPGASGWLTGEELKILSQIMVSPEGALPALDWAHASLIQQRYSLYGGERTWEKALDYYIDGNRYEAFKTLGHILHLIEDASVPAHTRQDTHSGILGDGKDPYELYTSQHYDMSHLDELTPSDKIVCQNFDQCFKDLASYTNNNFLSQDTITAYPNPAIEVIKEGSITYFYHQNIKNSDGKSLLFGIKASNKKLAITDTANNYYWLLLSKRAVLTGAAVIDIFFRAAEDRRIAREYPVHLVKYDIPQFPMISGVGELQKIRDAFKKITATILAIVAPGKRITSQVAVLPSPLLNPTPTSTPTPIPTPRIGFLSNPSPLPGPSPRIERVSIPSPKPSPTFSSIQSEALTPYVQTSQRIPSIGTNGPRSSVVISSPEPSPSPEFSPSASPTPTPEPSSSPSPSPSPTSSPEPSPSPEPSSGISYLEQLSSDSSISPYFQIFQLLGLITDWTSQPIERFKVEIKADPGGEFPNNQISIELSAFHENFSLLSYCSPISPIDVSFQDGKVIADFGNLNISDTWSHCSPGYKYLSIIISPYNSFVPPTIYGTNSNPCPIQNCYLLARGSQMINIYFRVGKFE
jgi:hypothetical protein